MEIVNDNTFKAEVLDVKGLVLVDFFATWCGPCRQMMPLVTEISNEISNVKVVKMDIDESPKTPAEYGIQTIPTFILFKNGEVVDKKVGSMPKSALTDWINSYL